MGFIYSMGVGGEVVIVGADGVKVVVEAGGRGAAVLTMVVVTEKFVESHDTQILFPGQFT